MQHLERMVKDRSEGVIWLGVFFFLPGREPRRHESAPIQGVGYSRAWKWVARFILLLWTAVGGKDGGTRLSEGNGLRRRWWNFHVGRDLGGRRSVIYSIYPVFGVVYSLRWHGSLSATRGGSNLHRSVINFDSPPLAFLRSISS